MELFALPCTTCQTRLKVRDESAIGKILACPKCGGMVLIKPPADWKPGTSSSPSQNASTMTATVNPSSSSDVIAPRKPTGDFSFEDVDQLLSAPQTASPRPIKATPAPTAATKGLVKAKAVEPPLDVATNQVRTPTPPIPTPMPADWGADRPWRYWLVLAGAIATGVVLAIGVVMVAVRFVGPVPTPIVTENVAPPTEPEPAGEPTATEPKTAPEVPANPPVEKPATDPELATNDPRPELPAVPEEPMKPAPADPLGIAAVPGEKDPVKPAANIFGDLDKFAGLLDNTNPEATKPTPTEPQPILPIDTNPGKPKTSVNRPPARKIDVAARLADKLPGIDADGVPLADFLQLMTDLTTIPITLETKSLPMVNVTPTTPVQLKSSNTTVGQALTDGLKSVRLVFTTLENQVVVSVPADLRTIQAPVDDLAKDEPAGAATITQHLTELFAPGDWQGGDQGPFVRFQEPLVSLRHNSHVLWSQVEFLERLRVVRGLPLKSKFDPKLFSTATLTERAAATLAKPVSLNFSQATPLLRITNSLGNAAKVRILCDWRALLAEGWNPDTEAILTADKIPLSAALDELVEPLELAWRVVDATTVEITTPASLAERVELELYPLENAATEATAEQLANRVRQDLGDSNFSDAGGKGLIRFDPAAKCLLVVLPQPLQRKAAGIIREVQPNNR